MGVEIGQEAPDFELKGHGADKKKLSDYRGEQAVALVFYPFTFTGVCQGELCQLRDDFSEFEQAGVQVMAISCDTAPAQKKWAEDQGFNFPVLSDFWPHGEVAKAYGVFNDAIGAASRATFLIGKDGVVVDTFESPDLGTAREKSRYQEAIAKL